MVSSFFYSQIPRGLIDPSKAKLFNFYAEAITRLLLTGGVECLTQTVYRQTITNAVFLTSSYRAAHLYLSNKKWKPLDIEFVACTAALITIGFIQILKLEHESNDLLSDTAALAAAFLLKKTCDGVDRYFNSGGIVKDTEFSEDEPPLVQRKMLRMTEIIFFVLSAVQGKRFPENNIPFFTLFKKLSKDFVFFGAAWIAFNKFLFTPERFKVPHANFLHPKEAEVAKFLSPQALKLDSRNPKPKLLYFCATSDHNGALALTRLKLSILEKLDADYDFQFKVVSRAKEITDSIHLASQTGKVKVVWINAHGSKEGLNLSKVVLDKQILAEENIDKTTVWDKSAFNKLESNAVIVLESCRAGGGEKSIAAHLAKVTKRPVIAPARVAVAFLTQLISTIPLKVQFPGSKTQTFWPDGSTTADKSRIEDFITFLTEYQETVFNVDGL